ncbi:hypothetical protein P43SY_012132 [Pythium insidiosum]|uniref:Uncharacterized protein n=1 Tax=Pythium insidiosum TaxID=114742 RepID=A0AAD5L962_PYTIN|nr:hypothetical protein P43SY_012132 [Pythium insidiosum]
MRLLRLLLLAVGVLGTSSLVVAQTVSGVSSNATATLKRKDLGGGKIPADQVTLNPSCVAPEITVRKGVGVLIVCRDPGSTMVPFTSAIGQYVHLYCRKGSNVSIGASDDDELRYLAISNADGFVSKPQISFNTSSFGGLTSLLALIFDNVNLEKASMELTIPSGMNRLEVKSTNAVALSLRVANASVSRIKTFNFRDTAFPVLPQALYERRYDDQVQINHLVLYVGLRFLFFDFYSRH